MHTGPDDITSQSEIDEEAQAEGIAATTPDDSNLATQLDGLDLSGGLGSGSTSQMGLNSADRKDKGKQKESDSTNPLEGSEEDNMDELLEKLEGFSRVSLNPTTSPPENGESSSRDVDKDQSSEASVGTSTQVHQTTTEESSSGHSHDDGTGMGVAVSSGTEESEVGSTLTTNNVIFGVPTSPPSSMNGSRHD